MPNFYNILRARKFTTVADTAVEISAHDSATPNFVIEAGGKLKWSSGSQNADTTLYRSAANTLKTDDSFDIAAGHTYKIDGDDVLTSTSLGSTIVNSSLTSLGNLVSLNAATPNFVGPTTINGPLTVTGTLTASNFEGGGGTGSSYSALIGDNTESVIVINHNLGTRDVFVQFVNSNSPYEQYNVAWEAYTVDSIKAYFDVAPATNSVRVLIYSSLSGDNINLSLEEIDNVNISSATPEQFLKWNGTNWINTSSVEKLQVQEVLNLTSGGITVYSSATPNGAVYQILPKQDGSIPFAIRTNFNAGGDFYYTTAGVQEDGSFYGSNFIAFSDSTSGTAFQTRDQSPFAPFTISNDGQLSWNNIFGSASIRLSTSASDRLVFNANLFVGNTYTITSQGTYNNSVGPVRDVFVTSSGLLGVNLSSERYKEDIQNITIDPQKVYQIQPVEFKYKEGFINEEAKDQKFIGLIAEQLHEIGLDKFVEYNEDGIPDSVKYSMLSLALIETVKDLNDRLLKLEEATEG